MGGDNVRLAINVIDLGLELPNRIYKWTKAEGKGFSLATGCGIKCSYLKKRTTGCQAGLKRGWRQTGAQAARCSELLMKDLRPHPALQDVREVKAEREEASVLQECVNSGLSSGTQDWDSMHQYTNFTLLCRTARGCGQTGMQELQPCNSLLTYILRLIPPCRIFERAGREAGRSNIVS